MMENRCDKGFNQSGLINRPWIGRIEHYCQPEQPLVHLARPTSLKQLKGECTRHLYSSEIPDHAQAGNHSYLPALNQKGATKLPQCGAEASTPLLIDALF